LCRGILPCNILYIGEAPGDSENALGQPFIGPAGKLLDRIIGYVMDDLQDVKLNANFQGSYAMTNVVCCKPPKNEKGEQQPPTKKQAETCSPRLEDFINLAKPDIIVNVGTVSKRHIDLSLPRKFKYDFVQIMHPASILRIQSEGHRKLEVQRCVSRIIQQIEDTYAYQEITNY
jgi:uracil-DNA glycosylase family 4